MPQRQISNAIWATELALGSVRDAVDAAWLRVSNSPAELSHIAQAALRSTAPRPPSTIHHRVNLAYYLLTIHNTSSFSHTSTSPSATFRLYNSTLLLSFVFASVTSHQHQLSASSYPAIASRQPTCVRTLALD